MKKIYILDTNVLINDPKSIFQFEDNLLYIPIYVLEELDKLKTEQSLRGRNSREACRILDEFRVLGNGLGNGVNLNEKGGMLFIYVPKTKGRISLSVGLDNSYDSSILQSALDIQKKYIKKNLKTILVTMDVNLRIRAESLGIQAAPYTSNAVNVDELPTGIIEREFSDDDIDRFYKLKGFDIEDETGYFCNASIILKGPTKSALGVYDGEKKYLRLLPKQEPVLGISPKNTEQRFAFNLLQDKNISLVTITGISGCGKAQPLTADVLTPNGYVKMGSLRLGDFVSTPNGKSAEVIGVFPQGLKDIYKVTFSDNTSTECCEDHLWLTKNAKERDRHKNGNVRNTKEIMNSLVIKSGKVNHTIPMTQPIEMNKRELFLKPYSFGLLLGDGCFRFHLGFTSADDFTLKALQKDLSLINMKLKKRVTDEKAEKNQYDYSIIGIKKTKRVVSKINGEVQKIYEDMEKVVSDGYSFESVRHFINSKMTSKKYNLTWETLNNPVNILDYLRIVGLWGKKSHEKFVPHDYLYSCVEDRIELLRGLMDTDGEIDERGINIQYSSTSPELAKAVQWLVQSLGGTAKIVSRYTKFTYKGVKKTGKLSYRVYIVMPNEINPFKLPRKHDKLVLRTKYKSRRYIRNVEFVGKKEAQCILINDLEHLYLTNDCIVTHNTLLASCIGLDNIVNKGDYARLLISRPIVPMGGKDIGFLPGTEFEKMQPWMQPIYDNLELLTMGMGKAKRSELAKGKDGVNSKNEAITHESLLSSGLIKIEALTYIRGRSLPQQYFIIDEAQNLNLHEIKTIITRCGEGTKIVLTGDLAQIDSPYIDSSTCGLSIIINKLHNDPSVAHITLSKGERSKLATLAATRL